MMTESMRQVIERVQALPPEEQDRLAAQVRDWIEHPPVPYETATDEEVMTAFEDVFRHSTAVLDYLTGQKAPGLEAGG